MKRIETEIILNVESIKVWKVLTDFESYAKWCSSIKFIKGKAKHNETIIMETATPDGSGKMHTGKGKITELIPLKSLKWKGGITGILVGVHFWYIEPIENNKTKLIQGEDFYGLYPFFAGNKKIKSFKPFYENINLELKEYLSTIE